ncbi:MAG: apolipoprotein N-acyltransferase [Desulfobacteraceae bacterium]|nr:MAG: apolipoprotein N-acyltransferase [Desulfobacteraceae bacterium]
MTRFLQIPALKPSLFYALTAGLAQTLVFPAWGLDWLAWFALAPLLWVAADCPPRQAFKLGLLSGMIHYLTLIYWIYNVITQYGDLDPVTTIAILLVFCFYLSLYPAFFCFFFSRFRDRRFSSLFFAALWVGLEYGRAKLLTGFPWCLLGYTQYEHLTLIQIAGLTGVYGVSFLIAWANILIFCLLRHWSSFKKGLLKWEALAFIVLLSVTLAYGTQTLAKIEKAQKNRSSLKIGIVQGNIDQSVKWEPSYQQETIRIYREWTRSLYALKPKLIIWPETSVPLFFQDSNEWTAQVVQVPRESGADLIFGSPAYRIGENRIYRYLNRAYHLDRNGKILDYYDKVHLVPFGEYVPLKKLLFFVERLVTAAGDFVPGAEIKPLQLSDQKAGILICFESIFPEIARQQVQQGADFLIVLTNDAWFGRTSAPYQHFDMAVFRAVENQRPLVRAANTGISGLIGPQGRIIKQSRLFVPEVLDFEMDWGPQTRTIYTRYGDWFANVAILFSLFYLLFILWYDKSVKREKANVKRGKTIKKI